MSEGPCPLPAANSTTWLRRWCMTARSSHGSARGRRTWSSQTPCLVSSRCSCRDAGTPCIYGSRKSTRIVAGAARRRFAAAITPSLVSGTPPPSIRHPRRFRAASRPASRAHRYPGAAPRSRPGASASGPLELSASVSVLICLIYSSCILPLHYRTTHRRAGASPRLAPARPGAAQNQLARAANSPKIHGGRAQEPLDGPRS